MQLKDRAFLRPAGKAKINWRRYTKLKTSKDWVSQRKMLVLVNGNKLKIDRQQHNRNGLKYAYCRIPLPLQVLQRGRGSPLTPNFYLLHFLLLNFWRFEFLAFLISTVLNFCLFEFLDFEFLDFEFLAFWTSGFFNLCLFEFLPFLNFWILNFWILNFWIFEFMPFWIYAFFNFSSNLIR